MIKNLKKIWNNKYIIMTYLLILLPIIMMLINTFSKKVHTNNIWYGMILTIGFIGLLKSKIVVSKLIDEYKSNDDKKSFMVKILPIILLILFLLWTLICCLFSSNKALSFLGDDYRKEGFITYLAYAGFVLLGICLNKKENVKALLKYFVVVAVVLSLFSHIADKRLNVLLFRGIRQYQAVFYNINHFAYYLTIAVMINVGLFISETNKKKQICYLVFYAVLIYTLIKNDTFGCYIAVVGTLALLFIYTIYSKRYIKQTTFLIAILVLISLYVSNIKGNIVTKNSNQIKNNIDSIVDFVKDKDEKNKIEVYNSGSGRGKLWIYGTKAILKSPIVGYGLDNLEEEYAKNKVSLDRPHNIIIQIAAYTGIPGLLMYGSAILIILKRLLKKLIEIEPLVLTISLAIIAYLMSDMFGNSMFYTSPYFLVLLGMAINNIINIKELKNNDNRI